MLLQMSAISIRFLGAAREVTGSCFLIESGAQRFLVDCGMFQGGRDARQKNACALDFNVEKLDFVIISHAHLDHCGLIPVLVAKGFRGPIYATAASADLMAVMLADSAHILQKEAKRAAQRGADAQPLYSVLEAEHAMARVHTLHYGDVVNAHRTLRFRLQDAGHILGAAIVEIWIQCGSSERKLVFSGDLGQPAQPIVREPTSITTADVLVVESTYGDRCHRSLAATTDELVQICNDTLHERRGNVIVPAFAVGRTQALIALLVEQAQLGRLRGFDVYIDSPLATRATEITLKHLELVDAASRAALLAAAHEKLPIRFHFIDDVEQSKRLNSIRSGAVIIAGAGMCDGGRIKHHLAFNIERPECAIVFTGFQARGTLGRRIVDRSPAVRIHGREFSLRASVHTLGGLSAHADQAALLDWCRDISPAPQRVCVVHGEPDASDAFAQSLRRELNWPVTVPAAHDSLAV